MSIRAVMPMLLGLSMLAATALSPAADPPDASRMEVQPGVPLGSRGLPLILFNDDSDDLKCPAYGETELWVPAGPRVPIGPTNSVEDCLGYRIRPLARTKVGGLSYCGNFGLPVWAVGGERIAALGPDPLVPILDFWKRDGRAFLFSMRMNDVHHGWMNLPRFWDDFRLAHRHWFLAPPADADWKARFLPWIEGAGEKPAIDAYSLGYDYSLPAVRQHFLDTLREACRRYDLDGVELDWLRYPRLFRHGEVNAATITAFVADARAILDDAARRRGHPLRLVSRVPDSPGRALAVGLDVEEWLRAGRLDAVVAGHGVSFSGNQLEEWVTLAHRYRTPVYGPLERMYRRGCSFTRYGTPETLRAAAATLWHKGADGLYLFNYYIRDEMPLLDELGDRRRLARLPKEYFLDGRGAPDPTGTTSAGPLPLEVKGDAPATVTLIIADDPPRAKAIRLEVVCQGKVDSVPPRISINGRELKDLTVEHSKASQVISSSSPELKSTLRLGRNSFTFVTSNQATLTSLSVSVVP